MKDFKTLQSAGYPHKVEKGAYHSEGGNGIKKTSGTSVELGKFIYFTLKITGAPRMLARILIGKKHPLFLIKGVYSEGTQKNFLSPEIEIWGKLHQWKECSLQENLIREANNWSKNGVEGK